MEQLPDWVKELTGDNVLAVYDVVLDIREELQLSNNPSIELCRTIVRFPDLMPVDGINMRDRYSDLRWKATGLLKDKNIIEDYKFVDLGHRWESKISITVEKETFLSFAAAFDNEFQRRISEDERQEQEPEDNGVLDTTSEIETPLAYPKKVTLHWLITHVEWKLWTGAATFVAMMFFAGIHAGQLSFVKEIFGINEAPISNQAKDSQPKELGRNEKNTVKATTPNISDNNKLIVKDIIISDATFNDIETVVKGLTSIVFDVKLSSVSLDTKYGDIDSPTKENIAGVRIIDLIIRLEETYDCKIEDGVVEQLSTIKETVMLFLSCKTS